MSWRGGREKGGEWAITAGASGRSTPLPLRLQESEIRCHANCTSVPLPPHLKGATRVQANRAGPMTYTRRTPCTLQTVYPAASGQRGQDQEQLPLVLRQRPSSCSPTGLPTLGAVLEEQEVIPDHPTFLWKDTPNSVPGMRFLFFAP